jgi:hypothetical protein
VKKPDPSTGLVIRYDYLWRDEARRGRQEGAKDRPCAVVIAMARTDGGHRALVAAITHTEPAAGQGLEIPPRVKRHLGLDAERSWIIVTELNEIDWSDPGIVPASRSEWAYGFLPPALAQALLDAVRKNLSASRVPVTRRQ